MNANMPPTDGDFAVNAGASAPPELALMAGPNEQAIPLAALQQPDETEQLVTPEVGDMVTYTVEGKISRIEGDRAFVTVESANGQPVAEEQPENPADDAGGLAALEAEAQGMA